MNRQRPLTDVMDQVVGATLSTTDVVSPNISLATQQPIRVEYSMNIVFGPTIQSINYPANARGVLR